MSSSRYGTVRSVVLALVVGAVALAAAGCLYFSLRQPDPVEAKRVTSPDGAYDALLLWVPPRFGGGGAAGSTGHYELFVVEAGEKAPEDLPSRSRVTSCKESGAEETLEICQEETPDLPGSQRRLLITSNLRPAGYEIHWQDERTLEFNHYKAGEVLRFGCGSDPRELVRTDAGFSYTKMPDEVCAAENNSPGTDSA